MSANAKSEAQGGKCLQEI